MSRVRRDTPTSVTAIHPGPITQEAAGLRDLYLLVSLVGSQAGQRHLLGSSNLIGRHAEAAIRVDAVDVSRRHARIQQTEAGLIIEDLGSNNGTRVNGESITEPTTLAIGDKIQLGSSTVLVLTRSSPIEEQLLQESKLESVGQLAGGVAHEFNNLMAVVLSDLAFLRTNLARQDTDQEELLECLSNIETAARRAAELTHQLLGFARRGKYENRPIELEVLIAESLRLVRGAMGTAIKVRLKVAQGLAVVGDLSQLHQVFINLFLHAHDAMPKGGELIVDASLVTVDPDEALRLTALVPGEYILISIRDTGAGMDEATRRRIFEPFFSTLEQGRGSGLGLATLYGIIKSHKGHVEVRSKVGKGSTFRIYLPPVEFVSQEASTRETSIGLPAIPMAVEEVPVRLAAEPAGELILVVEDVDAERRSTMNILEQAGYRALGATDGREAVKLFLEHRADVRLVLLDLVLPHLSGRETFRWLQQIEAQIRVLPMSGYIDAERAASLLAQGAAGFLRKPFTGEELLARVAEGLVTAAE